MNFTICTYLSNSTVAILSLDVVYKLTVQLPRSAARRNVQPAQLLSLRQHTRLVTHTRSQQTTKATCCRGPGTPVLQVSDLVTHRAASEDGESLGWKPCVHHNMDIPCAP